MTDVASDWFYNFYKITIALGNQDPKVDARD